jgi:hypothetical protein
MTDSSIVPEGTTLRSVADLFRSRNAGAFKLTFDFVIPDDDLYQDIRRRDVLNAKVVAPRLGVAPEVVTVTYFEPVNAVKITIPRRTPGGGPDDHDVDGAQQFVTLLDITI